jgi:hypothetical protein
VTPEPLETMPTEPISEGIFNSESYYSWNGPYAGTAPLIITPPQNILMTIPVTQVGSSREVHRVEEDSLCCYAGAMARSIDWLNRTHDLGIPGNAQDIYDSLRACGLSNHEYRDSTWLEWKKQFCRRHVGHRIITKEWRPDDGNLIDWLRREIKTEDVEIRYRWRDSAGGDWHGHIAMISDIYQDEDGRIYVKIVDDGRQGDDTSGNQQRIFRLVRLSDGGWGLGNDNRQVTYAISESPRDIVSGGSARGIQCRRTLAPHQGVYRNPHKANDLHFTINCGAEINGWSFSFPGFTEVTSTANGDFQIEIDAVSGAVPYCTHLSIPVLTFITPNSGARILTVEEYNWTRDENSKMPTTDTAKACPSYGYKIEGPIQIDADNWYFTVYFSNLDDTDELTFANIGFWVTEEYIDTISNIASFPINFGNISTIPGEEASVDFSYTGDNSVHLYGYFELVVDDGLDTVAAEWFDSPHNMAICGDATGDGAINLLDILFLIDYVYGDPPGPAPEPLTLSDVNHDDAINLLDILYLIDYIYGQPTGPEPECPF